MLVITFGHRFRCKSIETMRTWPQRVIIGYYLEQILIDNRANRCSIHSNKNKHPASTTNDRPVS